MGHVAEIKRHKEELSRQEGRRDFIKEQIREHRKELASALTHAEIIENAAIVIQCVAKQTQQELEYRVSEIVSLALAAVFPNPYTFRVIFEEARGKTQCSLWFERDGELIDPMLATGGGAVDIAAFALRIAFWSILRPNSRSTLVLDEPFRFLSKDLMPKAAEMVRRLSARLNLQIIMVTHSEELSEAGDKVFRITQRRGVSSSDDRQGRLEVVR